MNVVNALRAEFSLEERAILERRQTASPEAYALYLEARSLYGVNAHSALGVADLLYWRWTSDRERFDAAARLGSLRDLSADLHSYAGEHEQAVGIARRLAELSPNDWAAHRNLAQTLLRAGNFAAARESLGRSLELSPARSATHRLLAQLELAQNDRMEALREARLSEQLPSVGADPVLRRPECAAALDALRGD